MKRCITAKISKRNNPGFWDHEKNIDQFLSNLKQKENLTSVNDWNSLTKEKIQSYGGGTLLRKHSVYYLKCLGYPEGSEYFKQANKPTGYWKDEQNIFQFLDEFREKLQLKNFNDWNSITKKQIQNNGGGSLLQKYSVYKIKCMGFPEGKFNPPSPTKPKGYWNDRKNIIDFIDKLGQKLNFTSKEDWNLLTTKQILKFGGRFLLTKYSLFEIKCLACPEGKFLYDKPIQYKSVGYWDNEENVILFLNKFKDQHNLCSKEDWNSITKKQIQLFGGGTLFHKYSLFDLKCLGFPDGKYFYHPATKPFGYWEDEENVRKFLHRY